MGGQPTWSHGGTFSTVPSTSEPAPEDSEFAAQDSTARSGSEKWAANAYLGQLCHGSWGLGISRTITATPPPPPLAFAPERENGQLNIETIALTRPVLFDDTLLLSLARLTATG